MQVWFDQTQPWCNLTWMLLHTASPSGCSSCTGTGTLVFSTRDSQAGSSILDHGDAFDHIFMTTKIKQTSKAWTFMENYRKVLKIPPWRFNKKKARHYLTAQTVRSLQAIQPFCWHPPWSRWQPPVALLPFRCSLSSWSEAGNQEKQWTVHDATESVVFTFHQNSASRKNSPWFYMLRKGLHLNGTCAHHLQNHRNSFQSPKYKPNNLQVACATVPNDPTLQPSGSLSLRKLGTSQCRGCHWEFQKCLFYMHRNYLLCVDWKHRKMQTELERYWREFMCPNGLHQRSDGGALSQTPWIDELRYPYLVTTSSQYRK